MLRSARNDPARRAPWLVRAPSLHVPSVVLTREADNTTVASAAR